MVTDFGMSDKLGPRTFGDKQELIFLGREISEQKDYGDKIADSIDKEVDKIIRTAHSVARRILTENKPRLVHLAEKVIAQETLEGEELELAFTEPFTTQPQETPQAVKATPKAKPVARKSEAPAQLIPKQAPAS
jgi:cell division protease FtsH